MKHSALLAIFCLAFLAPPALAQIEKVEVVLDGFKEIPRMLREVDDAKEVQRTPLFDNAPFFRLRKGDKLMIAKSHPAITKGPEVEKQSYYLFSGGHYYELETEEEKGKLLLVWWANMVDCCLLFDWDFTMENAQALRKIAPLQASEFITMDQFRAIHLTLVGAREQFPHVELPGREMDRPLAEDHIVTFPGHEHAEFEGIFFSDAWNAVFRYTLRIGPQICDLHCQRVLQGPEDVALHEFEDWSSHPIGINGTHYRKPDPAVAKAKQAQHEKAQQFQKLVHDAIQKAGGR